MVKWTKGGPWYPKPIIFMVKRQKIVEEYCLSWIFHNVMYCRVICSNIEDQDGVFKTYQ